MLKVCKVLPLMLLASCSVGPDYERPLFWSDTELKQVLKTDDNAVYPNKKWFEVFKDKQLEMLITDAIQYNLDVKTALSRLKQARYNLRIGEVQYLPMIDAEGNYNYKYAPKYEEFGNDNSFFNVGFDATWELDIWGQGRREVESFAALYESAAANLDNVLLTVTTEVANNYLQLKTTYHRLKIAQKNLQVQRDILKLVKDKYKSGLVGEEDLHQAQYVVESTKSKIPDLEQEVIVYKSALALLVGKLSEDRLNGNDIGDETFVYNVEKLRQFPVEVIRSRPDVRAAENMLKAKNAEIGVALAEMFPNLSLSSSLGRQAHKVNNLGHSVYAAYGYTSMLNVPFLHWGELLNKFKQSKEVKEEYLYAYQNVMLNAVNEISKAMSAVEKEYRKNRALKNAATDMEKVVNSMKIKYKEGLIEFNDLLTSEQNLLLAQDNWASSNGKICQNIVAFYKAIGGGY